MSDEPIASWKAFLIVIIALAAIVAGIFYIGQKYSPPNPNVLVYNYFEFTKRADNMWYALWQRDGQVYEISLRYNPKEVEDVPVSGRLNETFRRQPTYITFDPVQNNTENFKYIALTVAELGLNFVRGLGNQIETACTQNATDACEGHEIVTCDDDDKAVIYVKPAAEPRVTLDGNCLIIEGERFTMVKAADRVLYHFYKIMP
jgi:hypothetical protein